MSEATEARDEAIARAEAHAQAQWKKAALATVGELARTRAEFTPDDVWPILNLLEITTHEPRALGAIMQQAKRLGLIEPTDRWRTSDRPECHARPSRVWRSLCR